MGRKPDHGLDDQDTGRRGRSWFRGTPHPWGITLGLAILAVGLLGRLHAADAQPVTKIPRIGYLSPRPGPSFYDEAFLKGLRDLGYAAGQNIAIEYRWANWGPDRLTAFAAELVRLKVEVIVSTGGVPPLLSPSKLPRSSQLSLTAPTR